MSGALGKEVLDLIIHDEPAPKRVCVHHQRQRRAAYRQAVWHPVSLGTAREKGGRKSCTVFLITTRLGTTVERPEQGKAGQLISSALARRRPEATHHAGWTVTGTITTTAQMSTSSGSSMTPDMILVPVSFTFILSCELPSLPVARRLCRFEAARVMVGGGFYP